MKQLIVNMNGANIKDVAAVLATWSKLAELVDGKATLSKGSDLVWVLDFYETLGEWRALGTLRIVYEDVTVISNSGGRVNPYRANVTLAEVKKIVILPNDAFAWRQSAAEVPEKNICIVDSLVIALMDKISPLACAR